MSLQTVLYAETSAALFNGVFSDRCRQFVDRHAWNLCVTSDGHEIDEYDGDGSHYIVVDDDGKHLTSCRLRPCNDRTMLLDHFSEVFPQAEPFLRRQSGVLYELTRFLRAPDLSIRQGSLALIEFAQALDRFRDENEAVGFVAVVYPGVSRFLRQNGVRFIIIDVSELDGRKVQLICLTQAVAADQLLVRQKDYAHGITAGRPVPQKPHPHHSMAA